MENIKQKELDTISETVSIVNKQKEVKILWAPMNDTVIIPSKKNEDLGLDIYANFEEDYIEIKPNEMKLIRTGLRSVIPIEYGVVLKERSSTGIKCMSVRAGIIDSGYRGEWKVAINNTSNKSIVIIKKHAVTGYEEMDKIYYPYEKAICQGILIDNYKITNTKITEEELENYVSIRDDGGFGASGK